MSLLGSVGMVGDIWSTGAFSFESPLKELLDSGNYTMEQLLAEDELLQELRGVHPQLIQYFSTPEAVTNLVKYVILPTHQNAAFLQSNDNKNVDSGCVDSTCPQRPRDPGEWLKQNKEFGKSRSPEKDPEMKHIRFPYMACEIICCEIPSIINVLVDSCVPSDADPGLGDQSSIEVTSKSSEATPEESSNQTSGTRILDLLFSILYDTPPGQLDDYRAGYFDKVLTVLFRKRPEDLAKFISEGGSRGADSLMKAMFSHLYSHSIMQIAQRLMLPQRPIPPNPPSEENGAEIMAEENPIEQDLVVYCDWSKSSKALDMLLESLIDPQLPADSSAKEEEIEELRLDLSLNASEVLITVIQNSMLSSETMLSLTTSETVQLLVHAATTLRPKEGEEPFFSPHESLLTSAMNVLESLILQLGGYGAVGTMFLLPEEEAQQGQTDEKDPKENQHLIADLGSVIAHLPQLLDAMSRLLRHPSTKLWTSPMQFSKNEPQQLLGSSRLRIVRVLESLVLLGDPEVDSKLVQSNSLEMCLDLFWEFQWCSMLHQSVANLLVHVFEGQNARVEMQEYFLMKCNLLGRLMDSFLETPENARITDVVMNMKDMSLTKTRASSVESEKGSTGELLPVSEDDVEAALERQDSEGDSSSDQGGPKKVEVSNVEQISTEAVRFESRDGSTLGIAVPSQSFRYGYMGHVIIICQALVHACSSDLEQEEQQIQYQNGDLTMSGPMPVENPEPLILAELVGNHPLAEKWNDFISNTLASETAIQSTPLGGYGGASLAGSSGHDPIQSHRPGLADDGDIMGDDGMGPPAPPRGMLGGGDVIDMDENDLDMAATMMAGLNLQRPSPDTDSPGSDNGSMGSGDSEKSYNSGETASEKTGYAFDDPLGKAGSLGIELGKLTQYKDEGDGNIGIRARIAGENDIDNDDNSSSDEEPERADDTGDVPVMDLFAGNFDYGQMDPAASAAAALEIPHAEFTDFANFDAVDDGFGEFTSATPVDDSDKQDGSSSEIEEIFGQDEHKVHLLEEDSPEKDSSRETVDEVPDTSSPSVDNPEEVTGKENDKPDLESSVVAAEPADDETPQDLAAAGSEVLTPPSQAVETN